MCAIISLICCKLKQLSYVAKQVAMERHGCSRHRHCSFVLLIIVVVVAYLLVGVVPALQASVIAEDDGRALMQFQSLITEDQMGLGSGGRAAEPLAHRRRHAVVWRGCGCVAVGVSRR